MTAVTAPSQSKDRRRLRVHEAAIGDRIYELLTTACALVIPALVVAIAIAIFAAAWPAFEKLGFSIVTSSDWDVGAGKFGAAPAIFGTVVSSVVALVIATPLAIGVAIFLSEFSPVWLRQPIGFLVDLLAAVPSVVYGLWGIFVLLPLLREHVMPFLRDRLHLGATPFFSGPAYGPSMLAAGIVLAIMALPYISAVSREVLMAVPRSQREAAGPCLKQLWKIAVCAALRRRLPCVPAWLVMSLPGAQQQAGQLAVRWITDPTSVATHLSQRSRSTGSPSCD